MGCEQLELPTKDGAKVLVIACSRGRQRRKKCAVPGCTNDSEALCDYPVFRHGKFETCDMAVCGSCRRRQRFRPDTDYCPAHDLKSRQERNPREGRRERRFKLLAGDPRALARSSG